MTAELEPSIRPPWPDELSRTWKFLGQIQLTGRIYPRIAVTGGFDRIVAAAALQVTKERIGRIHISLRTQFCRKELASVLLEQLEEIAGKEPITDLGVILPEAAPWRPFLEEAGFSRHRTDEWWIIRCTTETDRRLGRAKRLIESPRLSRDLTSAPLTPEDVPAVAAITAEHGLADLERVGNDRVLGASSDRYSPELSTVVRWRGEVAGVFLVKDLKDRAFVHVRAVAKKHLDKSKLINAHFMAGLLSPAHRTVTRYIFSAQPTVEKETIAMAKRFGGERIGCYCQYRKTL